MMDEKMTSEIAADDQADALLQQLLHLKSYEVPETSRMTRNKQNIMREVRKSQAEKRKPLLDMLEINIPWFFAEPKYGLAALFVAFIGLQYVGVNARNSSRSTGIYTSNAGAGYEQTAARISAAETSSTNNYSYPSLPSNYQLFTTPSGDQSVMPASFELKK